MKAYSQLPCNREIKTKVNASYSSWKQILFGVPQESILGPLFFDIFMCDLFTLLVKTDFTSFTDNNTIQPLYLKLLLEMSSAP